VPSKALISTKHLRKKIGGIKPWQKKESCRGRKNGQHYTLLLGKEEEGRGITLRGGIDSKGGGHRSPDAESEERGLTRQKTRTWHFKKEEEKRGHGFFIVKMAVKGTLWDSLKRGQ